jgi:hypothetical protein
MGRNSKVYNFRFIQKILARLLRQVDEVLHFWVQISTPGSTINPAQFNSSFRSNPDAGPACSFPSPRVESGVPRAGNGNLLPAAPLPLL